MTPLTTGQRKLFEQNYHKLYKAILHYCKDKYLAEDVTQEAFLQAFRQIDQLRNSRSFSGWVYTIAINIFKKNRRKESRVKFFNLDALDRYLFSEDSIAWVEADVDLWRFLNALEPELAQLLVMHNILDMPLKNIAVVTGQNTSTIKAKLYKARRLLEKRMSEEVKNLRNDE